MLQLKKRRHDKAEPSSEPESSLGLNGGEAEGN